MIALDLFCGGGGSAQGLADAGFQVVGVDNRQPKTKAAWARWARTYPGTLLIADALAPPVLLADFDLVWASPPCQRWSTATPRAVRDKHPDLINQVRTLLGAHPCTVIENVPGAPIRPDIRLTGPMVGPPRIKRLRHFEISWRPPLQMGRPPSPPRDWWKTGHAVTITTSMSAHTHYYPRKRRGLPGMIGVVEAREVMGIRIPMTAREVGEAVPPPMAEWIAHHAMTHGPLATGETRSTLPS